MQRTLLVALLAASPSACVDPTFESFPEPQSECPPARVRPDGACCGAWALAEGDRCVLRPWELGAAADAFGPAGARDLQLAIDGSAQGLVAWEVAAHGRSSLEIGEETAAGSLRVFEPAAAFAGDAVTPAVAAHASGSAAVVWKQQEGSKGRIYASVRTPTGGWRDPTEDDALSWPGNANEPRVAYGPGEETIFVWSQWTGHDFRIVVSRRRGAEIDTPVIVSPPVSVANAPRLAVADNGDAIVTWRQAGSTGELMVFVSERMRQDGAWSRPGPSDVLSSPGAPVDGHPGSGPVPAIDRRGNAAIAWAQENGTGAVAVFLATRDGLGEWTTPADLDDSFSTPDTRARGLQIAMSPAGELWLTWSRDLGDHREIVAAVRDRQGEWVDDGREAVVLSSPGADAIEPALAVGPGGEAVVVFSEIGDGTRRIVARRRNAGGTRWLDPDILSDDGSGDAIEPAVAIGSDGRAMAAWVQGPALAGHVRLAWVN